MQPRIQQPSAGLEGVLSISRDSLRAADGAAVTGVPPGALDFDEVDQRIIEILQVDGRRSYAAVAAEIGVSEGTVRARVHRLIDSSLLRVVGISDPLRLGFGAMAMIGLRAAPKQIAAVARAMTQLPETTYVAATTGRFDLMAEVVCRDTPAFKQVLGNIYEIEGVNSVESFMLLEVHKLTYGLGVGKIETGSAPAHDH